MEKVLSTFIIALYIAEYSIIDKKSIYNIILTKDSSDKYSLISVYFIIFN